MRFPESILIFTSIPLFFPVTRRNNNDGSFLITIAGLFSFALMNESHPKTQPPADWRRVLCLRVFILRILFLCFVVHLVVPFVVPFVVPLVVPFRMFLMLPDRLMRPDRLMVRILQYATKVFMNITKITISGKCIRHANRPCHFHHHGGCIWNQHNCAVLHHVLPSERQRKRVTQ